MTDLTVEPFEQDGQGDGEPIPAEMPQWFVDGITATALSRVSQRDATAVRQGCDVRQCCDVRQDLAVRAMDIVLRKDLNPLNSRSPAPRECRWIAGC